MRQRDEAAHLAGLYDQDGYFRSTVNMGRHRFGEGEWDGRGGEARATGCVLCVLCVIA